MPGDVAPRASRAARARRAAWPARPRSRRSSSPARCAASGRGAGRRGRAARCPRSVAPTASNSARSGAACSRELGYDAAAPRRAGRSSPSASARWSSAVARRRWGSARPAARGPRATASPSRWASPAKSPPDLVGVQVGLGEQVAHAGQRELPAVARGAQELLQHRQLQRSVAVVGRASAPVDPAVAARATLSEPGLGEHVVDLDVGVAARRDPAEDLQQRCPRRRRPRSWTARR